MNTKTAPPIPSDGPDEALFRVVKRSRLRYSQAFVVQQITSHPRPSTLLALVEVARRMGLKVTPVQTDADGLTTARLPAVVHLVDPSGGGGFAVLEAITDHSFKIWDSTHGRRTIARSTFLGWWSGVVVLFERGEEPGPRERRYLQQRFLEIFGGGTATPAIGEGRAALALRTGLGLVLTVLLGAAILFLSGSERPAAALLVALTVGGAVAGLAMAMVTGEDDPSASRVCRRGKLVDCHSVLTSRYSRVFAIPLSDIGLSFYAAILLLIASTAWLDASVWRVVTVAFTAAIPAALLLIGVQVKMKQLCTLCLITHLVNISSAAIGWTWLWNGSLERRDVLFGLLFTLYLAIVLFLAVPYFRRGKGLALLSERHRKMAASPFGTLAQLMSEAPTPVSGERCGVQVAGTAGEHEMVVLVHPSCGKCLPVLREVLDAAQRVPLRVFVGVAPKDPTEVDRLLSARLVAAWMAMSGDRVVDGYVAAKSVLARLSGPDGIERLAGQLSLDPATIDTHVDAARSRVEAAEHAVDQHASGTPAMFFDSRPFEAPVAHLVYLIDKHPDMLGAS